MGLYSWARNPKPPWTLLYSNTILYDIRLSITGAYIQVEFDCLFLSFSYTHIRSINYTSCICM